MSDVVIQTNANKNIIEVDETKVIEKKKRSFKALIKTSLLFIKVDNESTNNESELILKKRSLRGIIRTRLVWMLNKLTNAEREELRDVRKELQIIIKRSRARSFQYIVNRELPSRIFFGSGIPRDNLAVKGPGMSPFMRRLQSEQREYPGPGDYEVRKTLIKVLPMRTGYTAIASKTPRMPVRTATTQVPPVGTYNLVKAKSKPHFKPFGIGSKLYQEPKFLTPPPGLYVVSKRKLTNIAESFGSKRTIIPATITICSPNNMAICKICGTQPLGDYFHAFATKEDMCRPCMQIQIQETKKCGAKLVLKIRKKAEIEKYSRVRYCGFYHDHNGTRAAVKLMKKADLRKKLYKENYLSLFKM